MLDRVVIAGGGFCGLLTAKVLSKFCKRITIVERILPQGQGIRTGLPQAHHLHILLKAGQDIVFDVFPEIEQQLRLQHCPIIDWSADTHWHGPYGCYPRYPSNVRTRMFSRHLLDQMMHQAVSAIQNVDIIEANVMEPIQRQGRVCGVRIQKKQQTTELYADLVVDTRGRYSDSAAMLSQLCHQTITPEVFPNSVHYSSRRYQLHTARQQVSHKQVYYQARFPTRTHGVVISPIEQQQCLVTQIGFGNSPLIRTNDCFNKKLAQLKETELHQLLDNAYPISDTKTFSNMGNKRLRANTIKCWPAGLLILGDAWCRVNPVYGQGMTLAALQVQLLQRCLDKGKQSAMGWERKLQRRIDKALAFPWMVATNEDSRELENYKSSLIGRYFSKVLQAATRNINVHHTFMQVMHMQQSPLVLFKPSMLAMVLATGSRLAPCLAGMTQRVPQGDKSD